MTDVDPGPAAPAIGVRASNKEAVRTRITDALIALLTEGRLDVSHDLVAERSGVPRRTVYRYYPDRDALLTAVWSRIQALAGHNVVVPDTEGALLDTLHDIYTGFDKIAPLVTLVRSTPQGRAIRLAGNGRRVEGYTAAASDAVKALPPEDQKLATAMLQVLHTTPWLEMRDHWGLSGEQIARTTGWAIRTLLADLQARGDRPLDDDASIRRREPGTQT
jgi:AcrR family transcriptional regulator